MLAIKFRSILMIHVALFDNHPAIFMFSLKVNAEAAIFTNIPAAILLKALANFNDLAIFGKIVDFYFVFDLKCCKCSLSTEPFSDLKSV